MNRGQVKGCIEEAKDAVNQAAGSIVGNEEPQAEGAVEKNVGKAEAAADDIKAKVADPAKRRSTAERRGAARRRARALERAWLRPARLFFSAPGHFRAISSARLRRSERPARCPSPAGCAVRGRSRRSGPRGRIRQPYPSRHAGAAPTPDGRHSMPARRRGRERRRGTPIQRRPLPGPLFARL